MSNTKPRNDGIIDRGVIYRKDVQCKKQCGVDGFNFWTSKSRVYLGDVLEHSCSPLFQADSIGLMQGNEPLFVKTAHSPLKFFFTHGKCSLNVFRAAFVMAGTESATGF